MSEALEASYRFLHPYNSIEALWNDLLFPCKEGEERVIKFSASQIRFLAFGENAHRHRERIHNWTSKAKVEHKKQNLYKTYYIPKARGGYRILREPCSMLKVIQKRILTTILEPAFSLLLKDSCTGFRKGFSIVHNAQFHRGKEVLIKLDIADFFPSISQARVYGFFRKRLWASHEVAIYLSGLCTYKNELPQGAPTSPMIANILWSRIDARVLGLLSKFNNHNDQLKLEYSRYADDMSLSYNGQEILKAGVLISYIEDIIEDEGFMLNLSKVQVFRNSHHQEVTGIVVNGAEALSIGRKRYKFFRAVIHSIKTKGWLMAMKQWNAVHRRKRDKADGWMQFQCMIKGYENYISMISQIWSHEKYLKDFASINYALNHPLEQDLNSK